MYFTNFFDICEFVRIRTKVAYFVTADNAKKFPFLSFSDTSTQKLV